MPSNVLAVERRMSKEVRRLISGMKSRLHCRHASRAIFRQRASLFPDCSASSLGTLLAARKAMTREAPSSVQQRSIMSMAAALRTACATEKERGVSASRAESVMRMRTGPPAAPHTTARPLQPLPLKALTSSPARSLSTSRR